MIKATLFERLFNEKPNTLNLYKSLHPEDDSASVEDIEIVTLSKTLTKSNYNDLCFLIKDKLVVVIDSLSAPSNNLLARYILYIDKALKQYLENNNIDIDDSAKVTIPKIELYIINYKDEGNNLDIINISDETFRENNSFLKIKAKVISYDKNSNTILNQYIRFCQIFSEQVEKIIEETIKISLQEDILVDFLTDKEYEITGIRDIIFNPN